MKQQQDLAQQIQAALDGGFIVGAVQLSDGTVLSAHKKARKGIATGAGEDHSHFAPTPEGQNGQPSPEAPPVPEGFTLPAYAASMPNARGLIKLACVESRRSGAAKRTAAYWGLQDVLTDFADHLTEEAKFSLIANFGQARMELGPLFQDSDGLVGRTFRSYPLDKPAAGVHAAYVQNGAAYSDALTFVADAQTPGTHAADLETWAQYNDDHGWPTVV